MDQVLGFKVVIYIVPVITRIQVLNQLCCSIISINIISVIVNVVSIHVAIQFSSYVTDQTFYFSSQVISRLTWTTLTNQTSDLCGL